MNDVEFWQLVDEVHASSGGDMTRKCAVLAERLIGLDDTALAAFCHHFDYAMDRAYTWPLWGAAYTIGGGCGDDSFMDFRGTLISHGRDVYEAAVADPESLADLTVDDSDLLFYEGYQYVGQRVAEQRLGEAPPNNNAVSDEPKGEEWDEDHLPALYPRLTSRYQAEAAEQRPASSDADGAAAKPAAKKPWWKLW